MKNIKKKTVLYVLKEATHDDINAVRFKDLFNTDVVIANDGKAAVALYKKHNPDLVCMALNLPKLDGISVLRQIFDYNKNARIVVSDLEDDDEIIDECYKVGVYKYLVEPIKSDIWEQTMHVALSDDE